MNFDIWVISHASQFDLHSKRKEGDTYNPKLFADKEVYFQKLEKLEEDYQKKVKEDSLEK